MNIPNKPEAFLLVGLPGSGKSTWSIPYLRRDAYRLVSSDAFIENAAKEQGKTYGEVFQDNIKAATKWMEGQIKIFTDACQNIIWDQTNLSMKSRRAKLDLLRAAGYNVTAVVFETPALELETRRLKRAAEIGKTILPSVIESMGKTYQRPTRLEGFAKIIIVTPDGEFEDLNG